MKAKFVNTFVQFGTYALFCAKTLRQSVVPPVNGTLLLKQMEFIGVKSFFVIMMAAIMIGAVFGIQFGSVFRIFGAESMVGAAASYALCKELAPVLGAFLVAGRSGSAMTAETASMKVNDQIDAMKAMAVNPIGYLAAPRVVASVLMMPLLSSLFIFFAMLSCFCISVMVFEVDQGIFFEKIIWMTRPKHYFQGVQKAAFFGLVFSTICCFRGFHASGGAKGVGRATTDAVVLSLVSILLMDVIISYLQLDSFF